MKTTADIWINNPQDIADAFLTEFQRQFSVDHTSSISQIQSFINIVPTCITDEDNLSLLAQFTSAEIDLAVKQIGPLKAPGPDGLHALFYQSCWETVKDNIYNCVKAFQSGHSIEPLNHTYITLLSKVKPAESVNHYRPISLCNVSYKIIAKLLINRIRPLLNKCISPNQAAFIPDKAIQDNILIGHEILS